MGAREGELCGDCGTPMRAGYSVCASCRAERVVVRPWWSSVASFGAAFAVFFVFSWLIVTLHIDRLIGPGSVTAILIGLVVLAVAIWVGLRVRKLGKSKVIYGPRVSTSVHRL